MNDDKLFSAILKDKIVFCKEDCVITHTKFLDLNQQNEFNAFPKDKEVESFTFGGYELAERKIGIFVPKIYGVTEDNFLAYNGGEPICVLRIEKDRFSALSHRDYLGALMNLGIKREMLGDILTDDNGAYLIALAETAPFIKENLKRIGNGSCNVTDSDFEKLGQIKTDVKDVFLTVSSLRLDNVISSAFSLSRKHAVNEIYAKKVFVNDILVEKSDYRVPIGAKIVVRGKGKVILTEQKGISRKDRPQIIIRKYM